MTHESSYHVHLGDCREVMATLDAQSVQCCVTSPPYFGLRDYGHDGQIGLEPTPDEYVSKLVEVFRDVRRVLRDDGTVFLNLGDSYAATSKGSVGTNSTTIGRGRGQATSAGTFYAPVKCDLQASGLKPKDLIGIPWRVAFALQADGWYLRQDIIWHKPNPMPESVTDRCTKAHEYVFLLSKSARYFYDHEAVKEPSVKFENEGLRPRTQPNGLRADEAKSEGGFQFQVTETRNRRSVWTIPTKPYAGAHFAVMPPALVEPCILAGCPVDGLVLDPFTGSGTVGMVAVTHGRRFVGAELNPAYVEIAWGRVAEAAAKSTQQAHPRGDQR